jgi:hypothetical protein
MRRAIRCHLPQRAFSSSTTIFIRSILRHALPAAWALGRNRAHWPSAVARAIRREFPVNSPVLVAVSGYCRGPNVLRSADAGFDLHLAKPVHSAVLEQLTLLPQRTQALLDRTRELAEQHAIALGTLISTQLEKARTMLDLANAPNEDKKHRHVASAIRVCENIATCLLKTKHAEARRDRGKACGVEEAARC